MKQKLILAHTQAVARQFMAWKGTLDRLVEFILFSMKEGNADQVATFLRKESTQRELQARYETALWRASDKTWRLVSLAINPDPAIARKRINEFPKSTNQCRFCWQDEGALSDVELVPELDLRREMVPASRLHPHCKKAWEHLRALAEQGINE